MFRIKSTIIAIIFVDSNDEKAGRDGCGKEKKLLFCQEGRSCPFPGEGFCRREERNAFACLYADAIHADSRPRRNPAKRSSRSFLSRFMEVIFPVQTSIFVAKSRLLWYSENRKRRS